MNETNCPTPATSESTSETSSPQELTLLQQAQLKREKRLRDEAIGKVQRSDTDLYQQNRGAQTTTAMAIRKLLVPAAAYWLEKHVESATRRTRNVGVAVADRQNQGSTLTLVLWTRQVQVTVNDPCFQ